MIKIVKEIELEYFEAWSGGLQVLNAIKEHEQGSEILEALEEFIVQGEELETVTETWVNDFLWFNADNILREHFDIELFE